MPKTKISEYSATANSNTDVGGINIDEGCAPSGINDAIRTMMAQLKNFQTGTGGDSFNGPVNGTVGATTPATGAFTTLSASGVITGTDTTDASSTTAAAVKTAGGLAVAKKLYVGTGGAVVDGITVGRGAGAVATNTAVGASALASNTSGANNTAIGSSSLVLNTASYNTAVGYQAAYTNTTGETLAAFGYQALYNNTTGTDNTAIGSYRPMFSNTTGASNIAIGRQALYSNTTASNNTAVGYQAGYTGTTGTSSVYLGQAAGYSATSSYNTLIGREAGYSVSSGGYNTFVGQASGYYVTTGAKNTILGQYNGNQGGLDIRTASNYIVLSDGDGNPKYVNNGNFYGFNTVTSKGNSYFSFNAQQQGFILWNGVDSSYNEFGVWDGASDGLKTVIKSESGVGKFGTRTNSTMGLQTNDTLRVAMSSSSFAPSADNTYTLGANGSRWSAVWAANGTIQTSDEREKTNITPSDLGLDFIMQLQPVSYKWKHGGNEIVISDEDVVDGGGSKVETVVSKEGTRTHYGFIAQQVKQTVGDKDFGGWILTDANDPESQQALRYDQFISPLVKAIQELKAEFDAYKATHP